MSTIVSDLRKQVISDGIEMRRKDARIEELEQQIAEMNRNKPTPCELCKHARETNNVAFLMCSKYFIRKGRDGFCDAGRGR